MIRRVTVSRFKMFNRLEFELPERALIAGLNNSGKSTLLHALATWVKLGEIWFGNADLARQIDGTFHRVELGIAAFEALALSGFDQLWYNQETREPIAVTVSTDCWDVGFDLHYQDHTVATVGPLTETSARDLELYADSPVKALFVPSLSGLDAHEPEYGERVLATRLAGGKGGTVVRNMIRAVSKDRAKWDVLQNTVRSFFGYELAMPTGVDPIKVHYRHSAMEHWYDLANGASGFLQTVLVQSALLHSDATLFLLDEPEVHLHALLKEKMYRLVREHCDRQGSQAVIATHSGRLIEEAAKEKKLFLATPAELRYVDRKVAKDPLTIPIMDILHAEILRRVLCVEGKSDLDILREWAKVLKHPAAQMLEGIFWIPTAEESGRTYVQRHFHSLKAQVPMLRALEVRNRNGDDSTKWLGKKPGELCIQRGKGEAKDSIIRIFWTRYEIENYLIHPEAICRFVAQSAGKRKAENTQNYIMDYWPPIVVKNPFADSTLDMAEGKSIVAKALIAAGIGINAFEYYRIASTMMSDEIHPDVVAMLDELESQLANEDHAS